MSFLRDVIFANKLDVDNRLDNPLVTFTIDTSSFWNTNVSGGGGDIKSCSLIPPMFDFYTQVVIVRNQKSHKSKHLNLLFSAMQWIVMLCNEITVAVTCFMPYD